MNFLKIFNFYHTSSVFIWWVVERKKGGGRERNSSFFLEYGLEDRSRGSANHNRTAD